MISGDASEGGRITVNQITGKDPRSGEPVAVEGVAGRSGYQDGLLREGTEYLFALKYNESSAYYDISVQPHGNVPLGDNPEREEIVAGFERAAREPMDDPLGEGGAGHE